MKRFSSERPLFWQRHETLLVALLLLLALALRLWALADVPPGWRDDELSNSLVISQHVLDGELRLFYPDASGHEFLYHAFNALFLRLFGPGVWGIRLLSVLVGTAVVGLTFLLAHEIFDRAVAWIAALGVATSFWALMYSRIGQRHISAVLFALAAFFFLWRALRPPTLPGSDREVWRLPALLAGLAMGLGFYTYFASRITPAVLLTLALYLLLFDRERFRRQWRPLALTLLVAGALYLPLWHAAQTTPGAEARIDELARPVKALRGGDWEPLLKQLGVTLQMFHADGDDEWLYNVAHRPVLGPLGATLFFGGLLLALLRALPRRVGGRADARHAFLLIWLAGALAPGVLAVPAASLGHTLLALPVTYFFPALALVAVYRWLRRRWPLKNLPLASARLAPGHLALAVALLFLATETYRGLYDYFHYWPERGYVRLLHNADYHDVARYLNRQEPSAEGRDLAIGGALVEPWEQQALDVDLRADWRVRWFDPRRALVSPAGGGRVVLTVFPRPDPTLLPLYGDDDADDSDNNNDAPLHRAETFTVYDPPAFLPGGTLARFENGLALERVSGYDFDGAQLTFTTTWSVQVPLELPPSPLLSKPPPPGVPSGPRLAIFVHLLDAGGGYVAGQDGLGVDPYTLAPGDRFVHLHRLPWSGATPPAGHKVQLGLYDPRTGQRWRTAGEKDSVLLFEIAGAEE